MMKNGKLTLNKMFISPKEDYMGRDDISARNVY
jgi:hypothetical protein